MITLNFERTAAKAGFLKPSIITYKVTDAQGRALLQLTIDGRAASYEAYMPNETSELKKSFWGRSWNYTSDTKRPFVTFSQGWKSNVILPDETTYVIKTYRKWWLLHTKNIPGYFQAVVSDQGEPVFVLDNMEKRAWELVTTAYMQGTITTVITDPVKIAALLLAVQDRIEMQTRAAAAT